MTTFGDMVYQFGGCPVNTPIMHVGNAIFVDKVYGSDSNSGLSPDKAVSTLANALSKATANMDQVVYFISRSNTASVTTDYQSSTLDWNKDGVHLIGVNCGSMIGSRSRVSNLSTAVVPTPLFKVSANNCYIANLEFFHGAGSANPTAASICMLVSGQRNVISNCQISGIGSTDLDDAGSMSLEVTGAENLFKHCYVGLDTIIRATATTETSVANARNVFEDCYIHSYTSGSTFKALTVESSTTGRFVMLKDCVLSAIQNITSAVAPTGAIAHSQSGNVFLHNVGVYGYADVCTADNANVLVLAPVSTVDSGVAKGVDIA